jgi:hypothetical protein
MRFLQLTAETRLVAGDARESKEAILEVTRKQGTVLPVLGRLSLGVQQPLYSLDDFIAMDQEQLEKFDMRVERHHNLEMGGSKGSARPRFLLGYFRFQLLQFAFWQPEE